MADLVDPDRLEAFAAYADKHSLFDLFHGMVAAITMNKPPEPFQFLIDYLAKPKAAAILVVGPPASGQHVVTDVLVRTFDAVHVDSGLLLRSAMEKQTSVGLQAKAYVERGHLVPDALVTSLVLSRLGEADVAERGYVLEGFPRTRDQAMAMLRKGIILNTLIPDDAIISRSAGIRYDPVTGRTYHLKTDPPPRNPIIEGRLTKRLTDTEPAVRSRLEIHHRNIPSVLACLKSNMRKFTYPKGITTHENTVFHDIFEFLGTRNVTHAPRCQRIMITGLPGSGKTMVGEAIAQKYGYVHVSPKKVILEEISAGSHWGTHLGAFANNPEAAPEGYLTELIATRLKKKDCIDRGWVLEGYPFTKSDAESLRDKGIVPNRHVPVIWLDADTDLCTKRLTHRRYDPVSGRPVNLLAIPKDLAKTDLSGWVARAEDDETVVQERLARHATARAELEKVFGCRKTDASTGVFYAVKADGLGERDAKKEQPSLDRTLELVEGSLMRPIPIDIRAQY